jgi:hypothetical protein
VLVISLAVSVVAWSGAGSGAGGALARPASPPVEPRDPVGAAAIGLPK